MRNGVSIVLAIVMVLVSGCGQVWSKDQRSEFVGGCMLTAATTWGSRAKTVCECAVNEISRRWGYEDFKANETKYTATMIGDGSLDACTD